MIGYTHIEVLRDQIAEKERELAGWRYLLAHAEQVNKTDKAAILPDPLMAVGQPWPLPAPEPWRPSEPAGMWPTRSGTCACGNPDDPAKEHYSNHCEQLTPIPRGATPYPAANDTPVFDGTLPAEQEAKLGTLTSMHDAYAATPKARDEEQEWRQA